MNITDGSLNGASQQLQYPLTVVVQADSHFYSNAPPVETGYDLPPPINPPIYNGTPIVSHAPPSNVVNFLKTICTKHTALFIIIILIFVVTAVVLAVVLPIELIHAFGGEQNIVVVTIQSANTKKAWLDVMAQQYNNKNVKLSSGETIRVSVIHTGSAYNSTLRPNVYSPANVEWVQGANSQSRIMNDINACKGLLSTPVGFAMWKNLAEQLGYPNKKIGFNDLVSLTKNGWSSVGRADLGDFKLGYGQVSS